MVNGRRGANDDDESYSPGYSNSRWTDVTVFVGVHNHTDRCLGWAGAKPAA